MKYNLGFGPMSPLIVDIMLQHANEHERPLMIIASRNQVDHNSGYVMNTDQLAQQVNRRANPYVMLCRDHCGPYFLDVEKALNNRQAIEATKKTIGADIENGFDLIHIDTSRCERSYDAADELINFSTKLNPDIQFEFGTEENVGVAAGIKKYQEDVKFASQYPNMQFVVAQTGSLTMEDRQVGSFDTAIVRKLVNFANRAGVKLKEHNADYLTAAQIRQRRDAGVHALNIAPQLGVVKTKTILALAEQFSVDTSAFSTAVLDSNKWCKWHIDGDGHTKVVTAGHYCYWTSEFFQLTEQLEKHVNWRSAVYQAIDDVLNLYYTNLE